MAIGLCMCAVRCDAVGWGAVRWLVQNGYRVICGEFCSVNGIVRSAVIMLLCFFFFAVAVVVIVFLLFMEESALTALESQLLLSFLYCFVFKFCGLGYYYLFVVVVFSIRISVAIYDCTKTSSCWSSILILLWWISHKQNLKPTRNSKL